MLKNIKQFLVFFFAWVGCFAQVKTEVNPPENIRTIIFKGSDDNDQFPIIKLNERVTLQFDDISASEADYYYKIVHCNFDWTPSDILKSQYLGGFDNERIMNYKNSRGTLALFSNYRLTLPNKETYFKLTGNYTLEIFNSDDELMFSRRFVVYENTVGAGVQIKRTRSVALIHEKQVVQFTINASGILLRDPKREIKVAVLQNYQWDTAITNLIPQFTLGSKLEYRYDTEASFDGGNEYLNFDNNDIRTTNLNIQKVVLDDFYHHYLYPDHIRSGLPYTYNPDINGDFLVRTVQGNDSSIEADYAYVHFSIPYESILAFDRVYVIGKFNNYKISDEYELIFNKNTRRLEGSAAIKQGFYNYKYVTVDSEGYINNSKISGSRYETENNYTVLVYYRKFGDQYDSLIGVGVGDSSVITN